MIKSDPGRSGITPVPVIHPDQPGSMGDWQSIVLVGVVVLIN